MHPAARLLVWLAWAVFLQLASLPLIGAAGIFFALSGLAICRKWLLLLRGAKILLATLFLVFAYGFPGPGAFGLAFLPSAQGLHEAFAHVARLCVFLGALAWLLTPLPPQALAGGLWQLLRPLRFLRLPIDRSAVRLSLTLDYLERLPERAHWRDWLAVLREEPDEAVDAALLPPGGVLRFSLPRWRRADSFFVFAAFGLLAVAAYWRLAGRF
jgi:energy-coupling factor transporter transmembrane protein EcfT